jgi:2-dehydro-3-deoxygluconokinase
MSNIFSNKNKGTILAFGEVMLRLCPDTDGNWLNKNTLPVYIAGSELNAATAVALWGLPAKYFTALPNNNLSAQVITFIQRQNIDTSTVFYHGDRMGVFYLTPGLDLKHDALIYDRAQSAFAELKPGMVDWDNVLEGVSWFHFSAICPAVSANTADVCKEVLEAASRKNITISVDLNYRAKLWKYGKTPLEIMPQLVKYCDLIMGNIWAFENMLGIPVSDAIHPTATKSDYLAAALYTSEKVTAQYPNCQAVANTFRFDASDDVRYYGALYTGEQLYTSAEYHTPYIINKTGSGDCFMAGLIYGFYTDMEPAETLAFATAAAFDKLFIASDTTNKTVEEIKKTIKR